MIKVPKNAKPLTIQDYHDALEPSDKIICETLNAAINSVLTDADSKIWHSHPVWFLAGNPIVGYSKQKDCVRLMFWSGMSFDEELLVPGSGKFKDASISYTLNEQINHKDLNRWLDKSKNIQWDYKNIVKHKGRLDRIK